MTDLHDLCRQYPADYTAEIQKERDTIARLRRPIFFCLLLLFIAAAGFVAGWFGYHWAFWVSAVAGGTHWIFARDLKANMTSQQIAKNRIEIYEMEMAMPEGDRTPPAKIQEFLDR